MDTTKTSSTTENSNLVETSTVKQNLGPENQSQQTCCKISNTRRSEHGSFYFFAISVGICSSICLLIQILGYLSFRETKREILSAYQPNIQIETKIRDSLFYHDIDSLITPLCSTTEHKLYLHSLIDKSIQFTIKQMDCDSIANHKVEILQYDTKTLLDLQYHKIEHEFQIMQVWCGILTVIFLIFSFYSLFKADDFVKQGKEGLARLESIEEQGNGKINGFHTKCNEALQAFSKRSESKLQEIDSKNEKRIDKINDIIQKSQNSMQNYVDEVRQKIDDHQNSIIKECNDILEKDRQQNSKLDAVVSLLKQQADTLESQIKMIDGRIKIIEERIK